MLGKALMRVREEVRRMVREVAEKERESVDWGMPAWEEVMK